MLLYCSNFYHSVLKLEPLLLRSCLRWNRTLSHNSINTDSRFKFYSYPNAPRPHSPAFYTGNAPYYDFLTQLRQHMDPTQLKHLQQLEYSLENTEPSKKEKEEKDIEDHDENQVRFVSKDSFESKFGLSMTSMQYQRLLCFLRALDPHPLVQPYYSEKVNQEIHSKVRALDQYGRAFGRGRRKTSLAHVHVIKNPAGEFMVNGNPLSDYFTLKSRLTAVFPLQLAQAFGKYNIWAVVEGGGPSGQSEAIAHGLSKALVIHEPNLEPKFKALGLLDMDLRLVERKKYGQKKARKKFTWVKR
ncbi:37S ribosomal protein S9, mitochondrial [Coelomomyces lativittatus]|nr:37S ribosomal protein S9, mitochondrial [Coelomomyces lativittatus]KAJ1510078.1 37S ribosomal protein S9, mitochondrial [Coelomomyces lativittatus]KAJ1513636.1 37S ribosomal protein S9, mitochondrial [Coelomomyces lativittatus]